MAARRDPGSRRARPDAGFKDFLLEQLEGMGELRALAMFGGWGLYCDEVFFGIIWGGRLYFRTSEGTRERYEAFGMKPFRPNPRQRLRAYYEVPADVQDDAAELERWAQDAVRAAPGRLKKGGSAASE